MTIEKERQNKQQSYQDEEVLNSFVHFFHSFEGTTNYAYNQALGLRRANAAVGYLSSLGIGTARLEAVVSFGKTQPVIPTPGPEQRNRRTVTEVSGFVNDHAMLLNGKYAEVIMREYLNGATRPILDNSNVTTQVDPNG